MRKSIPFILFIAGFLILIQLGCQKELFCPDCSGNHAPVANAGRDTVVLIPDIIKLDGTKSTDADGAITHYKWRKISGPDPIVISNDTLPSTSVENLKKGIYQFELTVTDNLGLPDSDSVQVIVSDANGTGQPPIAKAGSDSVIAQLSSGIILDGSNSTDPDNNIASYEWIQISTRPVASVSDPLSSICLVTFVGNGIYSFLLKVTDSTGLSDTDTITFTIQAIANNFCSAITRSNINATTSSIGRLSVPRRLGAVAAAGNKIVFAGGYPVFDDNPLTTVDIYDIANRQWTTTSLSSPRVSMTTIVYGEKIYFAGGIDYELDMDTNIIV